MPQASTTSAGIVVTTRRAMSGTRTRSSVDHVANLGDSRVVVGEAAEGVVLDELERVGDPAAPGVSRSWLGPSRASSTERGRRHRGRHSAAPGTNLTPASVPWTDTVVDRLVEGRLYRSPASEAERSLPRTGANFIKLSP
jgi:hypothetical protein